MKCTCMGQRDKKEEQQTRNANERLLEKRELVTRGRPETHMVPGRLVMKTQSVTLNRVTLAGC